MTSTFIPPEAPPEPPRQQQQQPKRLTRSRTDRMVAGVCGGFAEYAGVDVNLVRLALVALTLFGGTGIVLYIVAWLILPEGEF
jgi:phage shock protein PspC (stress-responsive transcriptional regulator)